MGLKVLNKAILIDKDELVRDGNMSTDFKVFRICLILKRYLLSFYKVYGSAEFNICQ